MCTGARRCRVVYVGAHRPLEVSELNNTKSIDLLTSHMLSSICDSLDS